MKFPTNSSAVRTSLAALLFGLIVHSASADNWPTWRGPTGMGLSPEADLPMHWSATENIRWKTPLPESGNSTPVVWGNRIFVTQALKKENRRNLMCFNRADGKLVWQAGVTHTEKELSHETNPYCSASPVTDGQRVIAWFGSAGVAAYDFNGKQLWHRDLGKQDHDWGYGGSPLIHGDLVFIQFGPGSRNFVVALNKKTGQPEWQMDETVVEPAERFDGFAGQKGKYMGSFSAPIIITANGRDELIVSQPNRLVALNPKTGQELWFCRGLNPLVYASPIYGEGILVAMGGFTGISIAVTPGGSGDVTHTRLWEKRKTRQRIGSGVIHDGHIYVLNADGIAECLNLKTGDTVWFERVKGTGAKSDSWSSMVLAGDKLYVPNQSGDVVILRASPKFELIGANSIGNELSNSSLAISNGELFFRTHQNLWCISERGRQTAQR
ncbi:MAG: PQQ-like beta-propeller repeat protein [Verrucomicrobiales bacterium]|nr:PQQ-like beta-propeller repeat protein [Verrucomicrobiales bacterium]